MSKQNFISVTLLVSALAFNPLVATELNTNITSSQRQIQTITGSIASLLYNRGLDEDAAYHIAQDLVDDDKLFEAMINNFLDLYPDVSSEELIEHLSTVALHRQSISLDSYDHLVNMVSKIKGKALSTEELQQLQAVSKLNKMVYA